MIKLYYTKGVCSLAPHIALHESGLEHKIISVDLKTKKTASGDDYLKINKSGAVPFITVDEKFLLSESSAIMQYIADNAKNSKIAPENETLERYKMQEWLNFISTEMHKKFEPFFYTEITGSYKDFALKKLMGHYTNLNEHFEKNDYLMGENFTVADGYLFTVTRWAIGLEFDFSKFPHITSFMERMNARPAVQATLKSEGIIN